MCDWIEHHGVHKPCILKGRKFECKLRNGKIITSDLATLWAHKHQPWDGDIVAFRFTDEEDDFVDVTQLRCFSQVAKVIGHEAAERELVKVPVVAMDRPLTNAFAWASAPQGYHFWDMVSDGKNPLCTKGKDDMSARNSDGSDAMSGGVKDTTKSDGSTASYYELPEGAKELQQLISHTNMNAQIGEIFRACYRYGRVAHSEKMRDAKKIKFYAEAEIARLEKLEGDSHE